jgi:hypothetical protein
MPEQYVHSASSLRVVHIYCIEVTLSRDGLPNIMAQPLESLDAFVLWLQRTTPILGRTQDFAYRISPSPRHMRFKAVLALLRGYDPRFGKRSSTERS